MSFFSLTRMICYRFFLNCPNIFFIFYFLAFKNAWNAKNENLVCWIQKKASNILSTTRLFEGSKKSPVGKKNKKKKQIFQLK